LKALKKANSDACADKRKRDEICDAVVAQALTAKLAQYHTTVEEDQALLKKSDLSKRHRMAVEVRLGEKELLHEAIEMTRGPTSAGDEGNGERATKRAKTQA
jgi:SET domain-containing protein 6